MKHLVCLLAASALIGPAAFAQNNTPAAASAPAAATNSTPVESRFKDEAEKNSYAVGVMIATDMQKNLKRSGYEVDPEIVARAFSEAFRGQPTTITSAEADTIVRAYGAELRKKAEEKQRIEGQKNKEEGDKFLAENKNKEGVITLPSGLQYKVLTAGQGPKPGTNDTVVTQYRGTLLDGTEFDSSYAKGQPVTFAVGRVIKGWTEALQLMPTGSKWQLFVPSELAYGPKGAPPRIGPNAVLTFEIELQDIKAPAAPANTLAPAAAGAVTSDIIKVPSKAELEKGAKIEVIKKEDLERLQKEAASRRATNAPVPVPPQK